MRGDQSTSRIARLDNLLPADVLPADAPRAEEHRHRARDRQVERGVDALRVRRHRLRVVRGRDHVAHRRGARVDDHLCADAREPRRDLGAQPTTKNDVAGGDEDGAAERLREDEDGGRDGRGGGRRAGLDRDDGHLHADAAREAGEDLVAHPLGGRGVRAERGEEAARHGEDGAAEDGEWQVVADFLSWWVLDWSFQG